MVETVEIAGRKIGVNRPCFIIAEVGVNHNGDLDMAVDLIDAASQVGADAVKFQTFRARHFSSSADAARFKRLTSFELTFDEFAQLERLARSLGIGFLSTPLDMESARLANVEGECLVLTARGLRAARLFTRLHEFARVPPMVGSAG